MALIDKGYIEQEPNTAYILADECSGCKSCIPLCPYTAITFDEATEKAIINEALCKGCGTCVASCPSGSIVQHLFEDEEIFSESRECWPMIEVAEVQADCLWPETSARGPHTLVLGLGNDILCDDAIGLNIVRELRSRLAGVDGVDVKETMEMGLALLDFIVGYRRLILIDSVQTGQSPPGFLHEMEGADLKILPARTPHFLGVGETLALGRMLGMPVRSGLGFSPWKWPTPSRSPRR